MNICFECDNKLKHPIEKFSGFCSMCHKPKTSKERQATFKARQKKERKMDITILTGKEILGEQYQIRVEPNCGFMSIEVHRDGVGFCKLPHNAVLMRSKVKSLYEKELRELNAK